MRFMMLMIPAVYRGEVSPDHRPTPEAIATMRKFNEELHKAGALLSLDGLHPPATAARVSFGGRKPIVTDGPFAESKEVLGGYWIIDVASREDAIAWAEKCPAEAGDIIEIRKIFAVEDFPPQA